MTDAARTGLHHTVARAAMLLAIAAPLLAGCAAPQSVAPGSPAAGHLAPGDVIAEMNSIPIRSMADLRGRLYVMPPSTRVALGVHDGPTSDVVDVTLSASP